MSWTPDEPTWPEDAVEVGRVMGAWGIKGWIKVQPHASDPQALFSSRRWFLQPSERLPAAAAATALPRLLKITAAREHGDGVVASAQEVPDRSAAEALKGARVFVSRASFPTADEGEYYWVDLIGLEVVNREGVVLGTVTDLLNTGPHSVLRVQPKDVPAGMSELEAERLIPFVAAYIDQVDLAQKRITVDWGADY
jgi:16S rRNA processing protein RimM